MELKLELAGAELGKKMMKRYKLLKKLIRREDRVKKILGRERIRRIEKRKKRKEKKERFIIKSQISKMYHQTVNNLWGRVMFYMLCQETAAVGQIVPQHIYSKTKSTDQNYGEK